MVTNRWLGPSERGVNLGFPQHTSAALPPMCRRPVPTPADVIEKVFTTANPDTGSLPPPEIAWAVFEHGTVYFSAPDDDLDLTASLDDVAEAARVALRELGPVVRGHPRPTSRRPGLTAGIRTSPSGSSRSTQRRSPPSSSTTSTTTSHPAWSAV